ncbi:MAG: (Fe-S)-binding protein [Thermoplasmatota archaeon]
MNKITTQNQKPTDTETLHANLIPKYIDTCICCNKCMDACPVTKPSFTIQELNNASKKITPVPSTIRKFAFNCVQCGKCVPVCPMQIRRDYMIRYIKHKLRHIKPKTYKRYLLVKGVKKTGIKRIVQNLFIYFRKITTKDLSAYMENTPLIQNKLLFYPGCYIYSTTTIRQTLRLLKHVSSSISIIGGVTNCCGGPHLIQGEYDQADSCKKILYEKIKTVKPDIILTACAECHEVLETIKKQYNENYNVLHVIEYLLQHIEKFPDKKIRGDMMIHPSCRYKKDSPQMTAANLTVKRFANLRETKENLESCCFQWNHQFDQHNTNRQQTYLSSVKKNASTLACVCLTCYEELSKQKTDVEIMDIIQLFDEALNNTNKERKTCEQ